MAAGGPAEPPREIGVEHGVEALGWVLEARQPLSPLLLVRYNLEVHLKVAPYVVEVGGVVPNGGG